MIRFTLENQEYSVQDDVVIKDDAHEELSTYIVTIPNSEKLDIETMDYANLIIDNKEPLSMLVNAINEETISFNPIKYRYTLSLISETVLLQKIICPNLKITSRKIGNKLTIYQKLEQYFNVYVKPQYPELELSADLEDLLGDTICPEKMWNRPTMFEVFNELLLVENAQVEIRNHSITYKIRKMDEKGNPIDTSKLSLLNHTQNINDYANRLDIELSNGIGNNGMHSIQGISQRSNAGFLLSEDNNQFILDKPIDTIYTVRLFVPYKTSGANYFELDITDYVVENSVYQTYLTTAMPQISLAEQENINYKRLALHYTQGNNSIDGLGYDEKLLIETSMTAIRSIAYRILYRTYGQSVADEIIKWSLADLIDGDLSGNDPRKWMLVVNYKPIDNFRFNVVKKTKHNATIVDNQSDSYVDVEDFINSEQEKLNRLGNKAMVISGRYSSIDEVPALNDYIDNYVLAQREIIVHDHYVLFKGYLFKNYIVKNAYYGINSRKRNTVIATGSDALLRNDIIEKKYHFTTYQDKTYSNQTQRYLLSAINSNGLENISIQSSMNNALIKTYDENGNDILGTNYVVKKMTNYAENRINVANFAMEDNYSAGMKVKQRGSIGGYGLEYVPYVDNNGEFETITVNVRTNETSYITGDLAVQNYNYDVSANLPLMSESDVSNMFLEKYSIGTFEKVLYKDNGEITSITLQFSFIDSDEVIVGTFGKYTPVAIHGVEMPSLVIYYSNTEIYDIGDMVCKGNVSNAIIDTTKQENWYNGDTSELYNEIKLLNTSELLACKSWAIGTSNGELLLGVNCLNGFQDTIYMNEIEE